MNSSILILKELTSTRKYQFKCNRATKIILECPNLVQLAENAFFKCYYLESIDLRNCTSLKLIGSDCFVGCFSLKEVYLPSSVKQIYSGAFENCSSLSFVDIPKDSSLQCINAHSFFGTNLSSFYIPNSLNLICSGIFGKCFNLNEIIIDSNPYFVYENGILYNNVTFDIFFYSISNPQKTYEIPSFIEVIQAFSFAYSKLEEVVFNTKISAIKSFSFSYSQLKKIVIASEVENLMLSRHIFMCCFQLESVDLSKCNFIHIINSYDFFNCSSLVSISVPSNLERLGCYVFAYCSNLETIKIPENCLLTGVRDFCFYNCTKLNTFFISPNVASIGEEAFGNTNLTKFIIHPSNEIFRFINNTLYDIKHDALCLYLYKAAPNVFDYFTDLPVTTLRNKCFYKAFNLKSINIPNTVTTILQDAISFTNITKLILPNSLKMIKENCFAFNENLEYVEFNSPIVRVPPHCFSGCIRLKSVNFCSVPIFGQNIFNGCYSLICVYFGKNNVKITQNLRNAIPVRLVYDHFCPAFYPKIQIL